MDQLAQVFTDIFNLALLWFYIHNTSAQEEQGDMLQQLLTDGTHDRFEVLE